jgi:hypothetical protein
MSSSLLAYQRELRDLVREGDTSVFTLSLLAESPEGGVFLGGTSRGSVFTVNAREGARPVFAPVLEGSGPVFSSAVRPSAGIAVTGSDSHCTVWRHSPGASLELQRASVLELPRELNARGLGGALVETNGLAFAATGELLAAGGDGTLFLFDLSTSKCLRSLRGPEQSMLHSVFSVGSLAVTAADSGAVVVWDLKAPATTPARVLSPAGSGGWASSVISDPSGNWVVIGKGGVPSPSSSSSSSSSSASGGAVSVVHLASGINLGTAATATAVQCLHASPHKGILAGCASDSILHVDQRTSAITGQSVTKFSSVWALAADEAALAVAGDSDSLQFRVGLDTEAFAIDLFGKGAKI